jgi:CO dehydrogenase/acetyl-CoA synthase epsilon subunit
MNLNDLELIISNLTFNRIQYPPNRMALTQIMPEAKVDFWLEKFEGYQIANFNREQVIYSLLEIRKMLNNVDSMTDPTLEIVWTGPEMLNSSLRDTSIVAQEMFREAKEDVLIAGFAFYQGKDLFSEIAKKMDADQNFKVTFIVDVRRDGNTSAEAAILLKFKNDFLNKQWPGKRAPDIYFDPRTLALDGNIRSSMHAKCIVVDTKKTFITSANFTSAAHHRNIEAGVIISSKQHAISLKSQFTNLIEAEYLKKI